MKTFLDANPIDNRISGNFYSRTIKVRLPFKYSSSSYGVIKLFQQTKGG